MNNDKPNSMSSSFDVEEWRLSFGRDILKRRQQIWEDIINAGNMGILSIYDALEADHSDLSTDDMRREAQALSPPEMATVVGEMLVDGGEIRTRT